MPAYSVLEKKMSIANQCWVISQYRQGFCRVSHAEKQTAIVIDFSGVRLKSKKCVRFSN